jgi:lipopolysaccharide assembly outer membrane protein LptD (OstA)
MTNFMRGAVAGLALATLLAACAPSQSRPVSQSTKARPSANPLTQNLGLQGQAATFSQSDPKHPSWLLWKLTMKQFVGNLAASSNQVSGHGVTTILYSDGKPSGVMTAPTATGYFHTEMLKASGGVIYKPISPPGSSLRADSVIWNAHTKRGIARGNVHYYDRSGRAIDAPVVYFDSSLKTLSSSPL